jgi:hypothetical protein
MRFMLLMLPGGCERAAPGTVLDAGSVGAMMKYNESLQKAGVLLALDGLHPPSMGARVSFPAGKPIVVDGPFAEAKEVLGGYWMIQVKSKDEAIAWASRCPASSNEIIEVRQVQEREVGTTGTPGTEGSTGTPGSPGSPGTTGSTGSTGTAGSAGSPGSM